MKRNKFNPFEFVICLLCLLFLQNCQTFSQESITGKPKIQRNISEIQSEKTCLDLREKLLHTPNKVDFFELRIICGRDTTFNPNYSNPQTRKEVIDLINSKKYDEALEKVRLLFKHDPVDIMAHVYADSIFEANRQLPLSKFHRFMVNNLLYSIITSGDGLGPNSAYYMISTKEEYNFLEVLGFKVMKRLPAIEDKGHYYDILNVRHPKTGNIHQVYFNVDETINLEKNVR